MSLPTHNSRRKIHDITTVARLIMVQAGGG
jgi:hypothetical protein